MNVFDYFFEENKHLEKDFVLGNSETVSYKVLYENSLKVASYLNDKIGKDKNVVMISQNSVFFITVYLGILKSGNVCVPLDFSIEQDNLNFIAGITESDLIFCDKKTQSKLNLDKFEKVINESQFVELLLHQQISEFDDLYDSQNVAEIIFTSGSTGKPKGVMITHQNIISNTDSIVEYLELKQNDIILVVLPFYYCFGLSLLHTHLKVGGSIVLNNSFIFLGTVISDLKTYKCTGFSGVPSHYQMLLKKSKTFKETDFSDLRYITQAGGKLHNVFIEEFVKTFPSIKFYVMYGQTEATARLSYLPPDLVIEKLGSIGKAIPGVILRIIDELGNELPVGEVGEIIAHGGNIMLGYYKDPETTKNALKDGWLHTGDLAKKDEDGFIFVVAREKEIIKVGGKRVSPKEIEEVILSVPEVVDCTIKGVYDELLGEALHAVVVIDGKIEEYDLKEKILKKCKENLALYKIPQLFSFEYAMKVKSTGKK